MKPSLLAALIFANLSLSIYAQTPGTTPPPLPDGPLLARQDMASWQVTVTEDAPPVAPGTKPEGAPAPKPQKTVKQVTKTGQILSEVSVNQDGQKGYVWCIGKVQINKPIGWTEYSFSDALDPQHVDYGSSDFPDCAWVSAKNYIGQKSMMGHNCIVFTDKISKLSEAEMAAARADAKTQGKDIEDLIPKDAAAAYIDINARVPVFVHRGTQTVVYQFDPTPPPMQTVPAELAAMLEEERKHQEVLNRKPPRAY